MGDRAIILIPDISGFTEFTSTTEIDHAAHIITELLELIVESNDTDFTLAEIEGDAVLFYRKGEPLQRAELIDQCLRMFSGFHQRLMVIERDRVCQCGACQSASNLTLKFIAHWGAIKEIRVAHFVKATGVDMIVAHRLLKNDVDSDEYILMTGPCCDAVGHVDETSPLSWRKSRAAYEAIGTIDYEVATLSDFRGKLSAPPARPSVVLDRGDDNLEIVIRAPLPIVYQTLIDIDRRMDWRAGLDTLDRDMVTERVGMRHDCVLMGMHLHVTAIHGEFSEERALYAEQVRIPEIGLTLRARYELDVLENGTRLNVNVNWLGATVPDEQKKGMIEAETSNLEQLKVLCEQAE